MNKLDLSEAKQFVSDNIAQFHENKLKTLSSLKLTDILKRKNPYLYRAKNIVDAQHLVNDILEAYLASSEEKIFGDFLENLAVFVASKTCDGQKSSATGIDLEFAKDDTRYIVSIKSGPNWGNSSQHRRLEDDFKKAEKVLRQSRQISNVCCVLGICYGNSKTSFLNGYWKHTGQSFWHLISDDKELYKEIVEPLGHKAKEHNDHFTREKAAISNKFTKDLIERFCFDGHIDWQKIVEFNSSNMK